MKDMDAVGELVSVPSPRRNLRKRMIRQGSVSENYFAVQDAALILPRQATLAPIDLVEVKKLSHIQGHLRAMFHCLRDQDSVKLAVRLESWDAERIRYLVVVSTLGRQDTEESIIVGMDFQSVDSTVCTIGLVLPIWCDSTVMLNGDGSALQCLHKCVDLARLHNYYKGSLFLTWISYYESHISSERICLNEWEYIDTLWSRRPNYFSSVTEEKGAVENIIRDKLKEVMMQMNLDECTCKEIRLAIEDLIDMDLTEYKEYIDNEMLIVLGQMDCASKITDFLYLGSEWNARNFQELQELGITHILNVTKEIDSFFPETFQYKRISLFDLESSDLLPHWNDTWKFIDKCRRQGGKCLVHCKMGISRSAATVTAFLMKENLWMRDKALPYIRERRNIVCPNTGFMKQLHEYQGIIFASAQRHNKLFRSRSESNLSEAEEESQHVSQKSGDTKSPQYDLHRRLLDIASWRKASQPSRPKSWSPGDTENYYSNYETLTIGPWSLVSDANETRLENDTSFKPIDAYLTVDETLKHKVIVPRFNIRKKYKRRHTDLHLFPISTDLRSDDSIFVNTGSPSVPIHEVWKNEVGSTSPKKTTRQSSSPAVLTTVDEINGVTVLENEQTQTSAFVNITEVDQVSVVDNSPSTETVKNIVARLDSSEPDKEVSKSTKTHKKTKSSASISDFTDRDLENDKEMLRERSFSETQVVSVKNIVSKIETQYSSSAATTPEDGPTVTIMRSQSMPSRSKYTKSPPLSILPLIDDKISESSEQSVILSEYCEKEHDNNNNNNNNNIGFVSIQHGESVFDTEIKIYEKDPKDCDVHTLTQDELQIIREVGQTLLSDSNLSQSSSCADENTESQTSETFSKKHGTVRQMAKDIEKKILKAVGLKKVKPQNEFNEERLGDAFDKVNKLLMGHDIKDLVSINTTSSRANPTQLKRPVSSTSLSNLFTPTPYKSPDKTGQKTVKLNRRNSDIEVTKTSSVVITRSQSERIGVRIPRVLKKKKNILKKSKTSFSESELSDINDGQTNIVGNTKLKSAKSAPSIQHKSSESLHTTGAVQVKEIIKSIEKNRQVQRSLSLSDKPNP